MEKSITINISEEQIIALNSVVGDVLEYYSTLKNNAKELKDLQKTIGLSNYITKTYYNSENLENEPNSFKVTIEKLNISSSTKKILKEMSIITVGDLVCYTREGLFKIRYIKSKSVDEIESTLSGMGLKLALQKEN